LHLSLILQLVHIAWHEDNLTPKNSQLFFNIMFSSVFAAVRIWCPKLCSFILKLQRERHVMLDRDLMKGLKCKRCGRCVAWQFE
jgi:hypothetical protein